MAFIRFHPVPLFYGECCIFAQRRRNFVFLYFVLPSSDAAMVLALVSCRLSFFSRRHIFYSSVLPLRLCPPSVNHTPYCLFLMSSAGKRTRSIPSNHSERTREVCRHKKRRFASDLTRRYPTAAALASSNASNLQNSSSEGEDYHQRSETQVNRRTRYVSEAGQGDIVLRVVSYNLLAQHQIYKNSYLYNHCSEDVLVWERRRDSLFKEIVTFACDIMCLQEVQVDHYEDCLKPFFESLGFDSHFKNKTGSGYDGVAIAFRRSRFELLQMESVEYYRRGHPVLRADNVGLVLLLQPLVSNDSSPAAPEPPTPLCVATTHLYFNANRGDVKMAQLCLLLATVERLARCRPDSSDKHHPVVLCGDFNAEPTSPLFKFLLTGQLPDFTRVRKSAVSDQNLSSFWSEPTQQCLSTTDIPPPGVSLNCVFSEDETEEERKAEDELADVLRHRLDLESAYPMEVEETSRAERRVTSFTAHDVCCVDHIFYTPSGLRLLAYCDTVRPREFTRVAGIPNKSHGSDHIPLIVDFSLRRGSDGSPDGQKENGKEKVDGNFPSRL